MEQKTEEGNTLESATAPSKIFPKDGRTRITNESGCLQDRKLADRCVAGEVAAWEELYEQCHEPLLRSIRYMLGRGNCDDSLVDEMASRVWYALVADDGELVDRYDPSLGARMVTYLRVLARDKIKRYFRSEVRRRRREHKHNEIIGSRSENAVSVMPSVQEFLGLLTPTEKRFFQEQLVRPETELTAAEVNRHSRSNVWQLRHRIRAKLLKFLELEA